MAEIFLGPALFGHTPFLPPLQSSLLLQVKTMDISVSDFVEVIKSNKGHYKIIHKGFMYTKHKSFNNVTRWRCAYRGKCRYVRNPKKTQTRSGMS